MFEVSVEESFAAGHYLRNYKGECENPHGHNYRVRITLQGRDLDQAGLLLDFKDLKDILKGIIERLDHQMMNDVAPFNTVNPSAENLAKYFYECVHTRLSMATDNRIRVREVIVWETDSTTATYFE